MTIIRKIFTKNATFVILFVSSETRRGYVLRNAKKREEPTIVSQEVDPGHQHKGQEMQGGHLNMAVFFLVPWKSDLFTVQCTLIKRYQKIRQCLNGQWSPCTKKNDNVVEEVYEITYPPHLQEGGGINSSLSGRGEGNRVKFSEDKEQEKWKILRKVK